VDILFATHFTKKNAPIHINAIAPKRHIYRHIQHRVTNLKVDCFPKAVMESSAPAALLSQACPKGLRQPVSSSLQNTFLYVTRF
jgi:hypothetical protein